MYWNLWEIKKTCCGGRWLLWHSWWPVIDCSYELRCHSPGQHKDIYTKVFSPFVLWNNPFLFYFMGILQKHLSHLADLSINDYKISRWRHSCSFSRHPVKTWHVYCMVPAFKASLSLVKEHLMNPKIHNTRKYLIHAKCHSDYGSHAFQSSCWNLILKVICLWYLEGIWRNN